MKKFTSIILAILASATIFGCVATPASAEEPRDSIEIVCECDGCRPVSPFEFDEETGMPKAIDFEDALELASVEIAEDIFGYTVRETGYEVEITDDYVIDETKLRLAEPKFDFAHAQNASHVFYGVDDSDNLIGNYQIKSYLLKKMADSKEIGYEMAETKKTENGVELSQLLGKAMRAFWNVETEQWDICFVESALEKLVAKGETKVEIKVETDVETEEETEEEETEEQETVQQHTHSYAEYVYTATCTEAGYSIFKCECGANYKVAGEAAKGHQWDNGTVTVEPTETSEGTRTYTCDNCGAEKTESIAKLQHKHNYEVVVHDATCTEAGYTTYTCACGDTHTIEGEAAKGHQWDNGTVTVEPTETSEGTRTYTCDNCGAEKTESIAKIQHKHNYEVVVHDATCTEAGYTTYTCACGDTHTIEGEAAHGHAWDNGAVTVEPTVDNEGTRTYTCGNCGATKEETIAKLEGSGDEVADDLEKDPANNEDPRNDNDEEDDNNDDNVRYETPGCHGDSNREDNNDNDTNDNDDDNNGNVRYETPGCHGDGIDNGNSNNGRAPSNNNNPVTRGGNASSANPMNTGVVAGDMG